MPVVSFTNEQGDLLARVAAEPGAVVLDLVRQHAIPLHWRCGQGTCGTCRLRIAHAAQPRPLVLSGKERNVLLREGLLPGVRPDAADIMADLAEQWRLACHVTVESFDFTVILAPLRA